MLHAFLRIVSTTCLVLAILGGGLSAQLPNVQTTETAFSLGSFRISIAPPFQSAMVGVPGYNSSTFKFQSPNMIDQNTQIGRSRTRRHADTCGVDIGTSPATTGVTAAATNFPVIPPGFPSDPNTEEIYTEVRKLDLMPLPSSVPGGTQGCPPVILQARVRAGQYPDVGSPVLPRCLGKVASMSACTSGTSSCGGANGSNCTSGGGFPADSFFDIFFQVDLPAFGSFGGATLHNNPGDPLLVRSTLASGQSLPPNVVYNHVNSSAVPVFTASNQLFGWLSLAGHLTDPVPPADCTQLAAKIAQLQAAVASMPEMPLPPQAAAGQPNSPNATALWNGVNHPAAGTGPIIVAHTAGSISFQVSGLPNQPWLWAASPGGAVSPGLFTPFGSVDIDLFLLQILADGLGFSTGSWIDFLANTGPAGQSNFAFPVCNPYMQSQRTHQVVILDPGSPFGLSLTAASTLNLNCGRFQVLAHGDDTCIQIIQGPFCPTTVFYSNTYTSMFSSSNGNVTFGACESSFTESQTGFNNGPPRVAACWDDLFVGQAGSTTTYTETTTGWRIKWNGVPEFVNVGANTFEIAYDCGTNAFTFSYGAMSLADALVGITPGTGLGSPVTIYPSLKTNVWGGSFAGHSGFFGSPSESINALYTTGFDLANVSITFNPNPFNGNAYDAF